jgi:RNA polymerase sigma factor (sigma-70 family)
VARGQLLGSARRYGKKGEEEEIVQDSYYYALQKERKPGTTIKNPPAYVQGILRKLCYKSHRSPRIQTHQLSEADEEKLVSSEAVDLGEMSKETLALLKEAVAQLPKIQREVLWLSLRGKKPSEIAKLLTIAPNKVAVHKSRALRKLREKLGNKYLEDDAVVRNILQDLPSEEP